MRSGGKDIYYENVWLYERVTARTDLYPVSERSGRRYLRIYNVSDHVHGRQNYTIECVHGVVYS